jgi:hypothetical protein
MVCLTVAFTCWPFSSQGQNASATFGEISKIVASMWDSLDPGTKDGYKQRTELAKKEYLKKLAAYRSDSLNYTFGFLSFTESFSQIIF